MKKYSKLMSIPFGMLIFMCLGTVYSWSIFRKPLESVWGLTSTESGMPYSIFLIFYALAMPIAGLLIDKLGPKVMAIGGGTILALGWFVSGYVDNITILILTYGVMGGMGVGIVYGVPMAVAARWYPEKKGLAVGLTLAGFGLSPFVTAPLSRKLISNYGVFDTFKILGISFFVIIFLLSLALRFPHEDEIKTIEKNKNIDDNMDLKKVLKDGRFYILWICYVIGTFAGLMAIGISSPVAEEIIMLDSAHAATAVAIFAIFNGIGRPLFGTLTDKFGSRVSASISYVIIITASIIMMYAKEGMTFSYFIGFSMFWLILGGWLAIAPTAVSNKFGAKYYTQNYGVMFTAYGVGAVLGGFVSGKIRDIYGSYHYVFIPTMAAAFVGLILIQFLKNKEKENN